MATGFLNINFWYSYILFLVIIGGILVLFIYITRVASNEKFLLSIKIALLTTIIIILTLTIILSIDRLIIIINNFYVETPATNCDYKTTFTKFLSPPIYTIIFLIITYLLITLVAVVKITDIKKGPLRQNH